MCVFCPFPSIALNIGILTRSIIGAGVPYKAGNVTDVPLTGTTVKLELHHPWTYVFVNLGLGANATNFNISLTPDLTNSTGKGTLCLSDLPWPKDIPDGQLASLQVVTSGAGGSALYNCADIKFSKDAKAADKCENSSGVSASVVKAQSATASNSSSTGNSSNSTGAGKSAGSAVGANMAMAGSAAGLAVAFAVGLL